jgi:hypothetical protein
MTGGSDITAQVNEQLIVDTEIVGALVMRKLPFSAELLETSLEALLGISTFHLNVRRLIADLQSTTLSKLKGSLSSNTLTNKVVPIILERRRDMRLLLLVPFPLPWPTVLEA